MPSPRKWRRIREVNWIERKEKENRSKTAVIRVFLHFVSIAMMSVWKSDLKRARVVPWEWERIGNEIEQQKHRTRIKESYREMYNKKITPKSFQHTLIMKWKSRTHVRHQQQQQQQLEMLLCESHWFSSGAQNLVFIFEAKKIFAKRWLSCKHYIYNHYRYNWLWSDLLDRSVRWICLNDLYNVRWLNIPSPIQVCVQLRCIMRFSHYVCTAPMNVDYIECDFFSLTLLDLTLSVCFFLSPSRSVWFYLTLPRFSFPFLTHTLCVSPLLPLVLSHSACHLGFSFSRVSISIDMNPICKRYTCWKTMFNRRKIEVLPCAHITNQQTV